MMSWATSRLPSPNAIAAANATAPSTIRNVGAVSSTAIPSCVTAAKTAYTMIAYRATLARMSLPVAPLTMLDKKLAKSAALLTLRSAAARPGAPGPSDSSPEEREEQGEDGTERQDCGQALLGDLRRYTG